MDDIPPALDATNNEVLLSPPPIFAFTSVLVLYFDQQFSISFK